MIDGLLYVTRAKGVQNSIQEYVCNNSDLDWNMFNEILKFLTTNKLVDLFASRTISEILVDNTYYIPIEIGYIQLFLHNEYEKYLDDREKVQKSNQYI